MRKLKILNIITGVLFLIAMLAFMFTGSDGMFGYTARIVISGSMEPTIPVYTVNIVKKCDISDIKEGDIVLYRYTSDIIHRAIEINSSTEDIKITTKGDANKSPDPIAVTKEMVIGKVTKTLGWTRYILKPFKGGSRTSIQMFIIVCIFLIYILKVLVKRYLRIYSIYLHLDDKKDTDYEANDKKLYADRKERWRIAEIKYHEYKANNNDGTNESSDKQ